MPFGWHLPDLKKRTGDRQVPFGWHLPDLKKRSDNMTSAAKRRRKENVAEPAPKITWKEIKFKEKE